MNAENWIEELENQFDTYSVHELERKLSILKKFLSDNALDWYATNLQRLKDSTWMDWKTSFIQIYGKGSWDKSNKAIEFKYIGGSLVDYGVKKRRLLIEDDPTIKDSTICRLIMFGVPKHVLSLVAFDKADSSDSLLAELSKLNETTNSATKKTQARKKADSPCKNCKQLFNRNHHHSEDDCFFKNDKRLRAAPNKAPESRIRKFENNLTIEELTESPEESEN